MRTEKQVLERLKRLKEFKEEYKDYPESEARLCAVIHNIEWVLGLNDREILGDDDE